MFCLLNCLVQWPSLKKIMNGAAIKGMGQLTIAMIGMSTAVLILAGAVQKLSGLDWDGASERIGSVLLGYLLFW